MDKPIWDGIFKDFDEVPTAGDGFNSSKWVESSIAKVEQYLNIRNRDGFIPPKPIRPSSLPLMVSMLDSSLNETNKIIDFGGGLAFSFLGFMESCPNAFRFDYHIVEGSEVCAAGRNLFGDIESLSFCSSLNDLPFEKSDTVYINSVLQYISNWKTLILDLIGFEPTWFLLDDVPASDIPGYATSQNYYESKIPCWFFNISEIVEFFESSGYQLQYKAKFMCEILGKTEKYPMSNFPSQYTIDYPCTLLFKRSNND